MFVSLIIVLCDVCLFKVNCFFPLKFTFSHVCMLIIMYLILHNYCLYVVVFFRFFFFTMHYLCWDYELCMLNV